VAGVNSQINLVRGMVSNSVSRSSAQFGSGQSSKVGLSGVVEL
jgi:hypothetical protein